MFTEKEKFLVLIKSGDEYWADMMTEYEIIDHVDMQDCTDEHIEVYRVRYGKTPENLKVLGCWHKFEDPLYIAVVNGEGEIVFDGYGTDH